MDECKPLVRGDGAAPDCVLVRARGNVRRGKAVQVAPIKSTLEAPGSKPVKVQCDEPLSNFAVNSNLRRYAAVMKQDEEMVKQRENILSVESYILSRQCPFRRTDP